MVCWKPHHSVNNSVDPSYVPYGFRHFVFPRLYPKCFAPELLNRLVVRISFHGMKYVAKLRITTTERVLDFSRIEGCARCIGRYAARTGQGGNIRCVERQLTLGRFLMGRLNMLFRKWMIQYKIPLQSLCCSSDRHRFPMYALTFVSANDITLSAAFIADSLPFPCFSNRSIMSI